jgi:hypothetical protein
MEAQTSFTQPQAQQPVAKSRVIAKQQLDSWTLIRPALSGVVGVGIGFVISYLLGWC